MLRWITRLSQRCMGRFILRSFYRGALMPTDEAILEGTPQIACPSGGTVAVLQHVMHQGSDLVAGDGGSVAQWKLHRLFL